MLNKKFKDYRIILGSASPRRKFLLEGLDLDFEVMTKDVQEQYPPNLKREEIALYLCELKAKAFEDVLDEKTILITADTIVWIDNKVLSKPESEEDAINILTQLSGNMHEVITGICIRNGKKQKSFFALTKVYFRKLTQEEIKYYVSRYKPFDKAGAYGAQEWIGYVAIERIEGSYFNVMGLPTRLLYEELMKF